MKKFITLAYFAILTLVYIIGIVSCSYDTPPESSLEYNYKVVVIDECQYIKKYNGYQAGYDFCHKGNCNNPIHKCK